jgi:glyoxylase-like metal-dependent hydrolase (beta-lactamase superfamily II)
MSVVVVFTFNDFSENTYLIHDDTKQCIIIDPGNNSPTEDQTLSDFITANELQPVRLLNTHCHLDHVFGNKYVSDTYQLGLEIHEGELPVLQASPQVSKMYGIPYTNLSPEPKSFLQPGEHIEFGETKLSIHFSPGHSPASVSFYNEEEGYIIGGDVLFRGSIGRSDLPGGDFDTLISSIKTTFLSLPDETRVYSGHGPMTKVGDERLYNPFLQV